jgi:hypothetical protein
MAKHKLSIITALALIGLIASLWFLYQATAGLHERDEQLQRLRQRLAKLEDDVARLSTTGPFGLTVEDSEAYLALGYKEFDATPGSGFRRFRDQPQSTTRAGALIEQYLERHPELSREQRMTLTFHAAQLFAMGGMHERAITHLDRAQLPNGKANLVADATKAFLLFDREGLLAARRRMADGDAAKVVDLLIERFGESYADLLRIPICSTVSLPAGASPNHRAAADKLAKAFGLPVTVTSNATEGGVPGNCIWLEVRALGGASDVDGYMILHADKSTMITATSEQRLDAAVKRFIESSRQHNDKHQAPLGLTTSFELAR